MRNALEKLVRLSEKLRDGYCESMIAWKTTKKLEISPSKFSHKILNGAKNAAVVL